MNIKELVKEHCPAAIYPVIRFQYRVFMWPIRTYKRRQLSTKMLKYLPYYQDELSREILFDCLQYLKTNDCNIFMDRAEKLGIRFHSLLYGKDKEYSGVVVVYDNEGRDFRYTKRLFSSCDLSYKYRFMTLKEFLDGGEISGSDLVALVLTLKGLRAFKNSPRSRSLHVRDNLLYAEREDLQYLDVFSPVDDEVVIDAGAYDGATAINFLEWGKGKVKHVYSFELDPVNAARCEETFKPYADKVTLVPKGTWDKDAVIHINATGGTRSGIRGLGDTEAYLTSIDNVVKDERVTFIKMDVEGAELKSLMGARNTIIKNHPRLAICAYHKPEDMYEIPGYILSIVPEYKFYLRHYSLCSFETVLYAYCE